MLFDTFYCYHHCRYLSQLINAGCRWVHREWRRSQPIDLVFFRVTASCWRLPALLCLITQALWNGVRFESSEIPEWRAQCPNSCSIILRGNGETAHCSIFHRGIVTVIARLRQFSDEWGNVISRLCLIAWLSFHYCWLNVLARLNCQSNSTFLQPEPFAQRYLFSLETLWFIPSSV